MDIFKKKKRFYKIKSFTSLLYLSLALDFCSLSLAMNDDGINGQSRTPSERRAVNSLLRYARETENQYQSTGYPHARGPKINIIEISEDSDIEEPSSENRNQGQPTRNPSTQDNRNDRNTTTSQSTYAEENRNQRQSAGNSSTQNNRNNKNTTTFQSTHVEENRNQDQQAEKSNKPNLRPSIGERQASHNFLNSIEVIGQKFEEGIIAKKLIITDADGINLQERETKVLREFLEIDRQPIREIALEHLRLSILEVKALMPGFTKSNITHLSLEDNLMGPEELKILADELSTLHVLNLARNKITSGKEFAHLKRLISKSTYLEVLNLSNNYLQCIGAKGLVEVLLEKGKDSKLININLSLNQIQGSGTKALVNALSKISIKHLNLAGNNLTTGESTIKAGDIADRLPTSNIVELDLSHTGLRRLPSGIQEIKRRKNDEKCNQKSSVMGINLFKKKKFSKSPLEEKIWRLHQDGTPLALISIILTD